MDDTTFVQQITPWESSGALIPHAKMGAPNWVFVANAATFSSLKRVKV